MSDEPPDELVDQDEPESTLPSGGLDWHMLAFADEDSARDLANRMGQALHYISRYIDLELLDGITVAYNYAEALRALDRGVSNLRPLTPSEGEIVGVAMSPAVLRDGQAKTHIVLSAEYMGGFFDDEPGDAFRFSLSILAHECAHVEVHKYQEMAFPGSLLRHSFDDFETATMHHMAEICWEEYAACRLSAMFARNEGATYAASVVETCRVARQRATSEIIAYRTHADLDRLIGEAGAAIQTPLKCAAYLLGHMDAFEEEWEAYPEARVSLEENDYAGHVDQLRSALRLMWEERGAWKSWGAFDPVRDVVRELYDSNGLFFRGDRLDVPFTPDTMPWS